MGKILIQHGLFALIFLRFFQDFATFEGADVPLSLDNPPYFPCIGHELVIYRLLPWIRRGDHVLLVGPGSCGKSRILQQAMDRLEIRRILRVFCTYSTSGQVIINKLKENCILIPVANGKIMRPRNSDRLVLHIKDLHVVRRDKWKQSQVEALIRQVSC